MDLDLWAKNRGPTHIISFAETAWRIVEAQHIFSTRKLVDSVMEQEILEDLIEAVKPPLLSKEFMGLHPLLYTPFRYPPLQYGSRFGKQTERSLWYGSLQLHTAMTEKAFYQFNFLQASKASFGIVEMMLTAFSTQIKTERGIKLTQLPFAKYTQKISSPNHYQASQSLGSAMRANKIEAFCYTSARDPEQGTNLALFSPKAFQSKKPNAASFQTWHCTCNSHAIEFSRTSALHNETKIFSLDSFLVDGKLPLPANT
jgi:hypothetical protein